MRLRRIELAIIGITLVFAVFMGGFFTGRSWSAVNIVSVSSQDQETDSMGVQMQTNEISVSDAPANSDSQTSTEANDSPAVVADQQPSGSGNDAQQESVSTPSARGGDGKININLATQSELTDLPGIGSVLASRIVDYRRQHGEFSRIEELRNVSGIGEKRYEAIRDLITVG